MKAAIVLRSALFMAALAVFTPLYVSGLLLLFWLPKRRLHRLALPWADVAMWLTRTILRIESRVLGRENIPDGPAIVLAKHQSAWETIALQQLFPPAVFVMKRELYRVPFFGWGLKLMPYISIDRGAGKDALAQVAEQGKARLAEGYRVVIFPEGTRVAPGHKRRYKIGGAHLAAVSGAPVVPVALNSGECWRRQAFLKRPGTVTVSIGPPIDPSGLSPEDVNARAEAWIESEMQRISPHRYGKKTASAATAPAA